MEEDLTRPVSAGRPPLKEGRCGGLTPWPPLPRLRLGRGGADWAERAGLAAGMPPTSLRLGEVEEDPTRPASAGRPPLKEGRCGGFTPGPLSRACGWGEGERIEERVFSETGCRR